MLGTGFLISNDGKIVTARHVIGNETNDLVVLMPHINNIDEYQELQERRKVKFKKARDTFDLTILTTTDCNARCHYCYEKGIQKEHLSLRTQQRIIDIIKEQFSRGKRIHISWFGGEPLLALDKIKYFSLYSVSPPSIKEVADEMYYLNQNIEEVAEIIIKQNLMILRRLEELSDRLDKLENSSDKMNESSLSENIEDKMERIEMKINYLLDNK